MIGEFNDKQRIIEQYDAACKELLSQKVILAWIMKECMTEYKNCSVDEIMRDYIESDPQVSKIAVDGERSEWLPLIRGGSMEDASVSEGRVTYDIRFTGIVPATGRRLWIDVEPQNDFWPGYSLLKRGTYYLARMMSSQRGREFVGSDYDKLKKAYTVWICMNPPKKWRHRIKYYEVRDRDNGDLEMFGFQDYDLMTQVVICLGDPRDTKAVGVLRLLSALLTNVYEPEMKRQILEYEFGITMTDAMRKGIKSMCNLGEGLFNKAKAEAMVALRDVVKAEVKAEAKAEAKIEVRGNINSLYRLLFSENRIEDVQKAIADDTYLDQLLEEYSLA